ncbi:ABC transporter permease subunit [Bacillus sp. 2205SS5-2]|uniref:ABC transporter permease subunit n=1 Tax=Bacillus sp. 2205SS5-2 TaxID=3109031 RepID=UPI00300535BF
MNVFMYELKAIRKSTLIWTGALVVLVVFFMSMFPAITKEIEEFKKLLAGFPEGVRAALGIQIDTIGSVVGFYSYTFVYITLCGAIQAMNLGISIGSKEVREKTADFLFTKPIARRKILGSKLLASLTSLVFTNIIFITAATIMANAIKNEAYSTEVFMLISLSLFYLQLIFLALGIIVSVLFSKIKSVVSVSLGIVFMFFVIGMVAASDDVGRYFTPFKYFDNAYIMQNSSYEWSYIITGLGIMIISLVASYILYLKKDIHTV